MKLKKIVSLICIFVIFNMTISSSYGMMDMGIQKQENSISELATAELWVKSSDEPASFLAYNHVYTDSYKSELSAVQKTYYEKLQSAYLGSDGMPNGNASAISFSPANAINLTVNSDGSLTTESKTIVSGIYNDIAYAYFAFMNDHPEVFWAGGVEYGVNYSYQSTGEGKITKIRITPELKYANAVNDTEAFVSGVNQAVTAIKAKRTGTDAYSTVKAIHDYLCEKVSYNDEAVKYPENYMSAHTAAPVFTETKPSVVCEGYGKSFKILCDAFDVPCATIIGTGKSEAHLWNYVKIDGNWYAVDVTWDDQSSIVYTYFLAGENGMSDHTPNPKGFSSKGTVSFAYPVLNSTGYKSSSTEDSCSHSWNSGKTTKYATCTADGVITYTCTICKDTKTETIPKIASQKLSVTKYVYSGSTKKPTVTVKDSAGNELVNGTDYTLPASYGKKSVGRYAVTITYKGKYSGTKTLYFTIVPKAPATASANLSSASQTSGYDDIKFKWDPSTGASGYNVYYKKSSASSYTFYKAVTGTSVTKKNLSDGVKYTFKVVPYYKDANGTKYSSTKQYKTASVYTLKKISQPTVTKSGTKVKVKWKNISGETGYQISQSTSKTGTKIVATYKTTNGTYKTVSATKGKTYYYKVRAYKVVDGKKIYGPWSEVRKYKR